MEKFAMARERRGKEKGEGDFKGERKDKIK